MEQVFRDLRHDRGVNGLRQGRAQQAEEGRSTHHDQAVEVPATVGRFELRGDAPREHLCFVLARR